MSKLPAEEKVTVASISNLLDIEHTRDIEELQAKWVGVNTRCPISLRNWFDAHPHLTIRDMARVAGVNRETISDWRKLAGWQEPAWRRWTLKHKPPVSTKQRAAILVAPEGWDTAWCVEMYKKGYTVVQLSRATKRSKFAMRKRLRRHIKLRTPKEASRSKNPCCTLAWVFEHYVTKGLSEGECAKLAGIRRYTFTAWLDRFKIRPRSNVERHLIRHGTDLGKLARPSTDADRARQRRTDMARKTDRALQNEGDRAILAHQQEAS